MANILGLSFFYHDSAAALVQNGRITAAAAEERFSRRKHSQEFPKLAINFCLEQSGLSSINQIDALVFYEKPAIKFHRIIQNYCETWPKGLHSFVNQMPYFLQSKMNVFEVIRSQIPDYQGEILFTDHHLSHSANAFFSSPFQEAGILTLDGVGEWETCSIGLGRNQKIDIKKSIQYPHSLGLLYATVTSYLGFEVNEGEWKVMGLSAYGKPSLKEKFKDLIKLNLDGSFELNLKYFSFPYSEQSMANIKNWHELFGILPRNPDEPILNCHYDLAKSCQEVIEEAIIALAIEIKRTYSCKNLVLAGGVALNGLSNARIERELQIPVWIPPAPGDDGSAAGAALFVAHQIFNESRNQMSSAALGPSFSNTEIENFLKDQKVDYQRFNNEELCQKTAEAIASGKVVGWFQGAMEFGPRALGYRSILADPRNKKMKDILNERVKFRENFRPFAPAVLFEEASDFFEVTPGQDYAFMSKIVRVRSDKKELIAAVTHEDNTARIQTVRRDENPLFYNLISEFKKITQIPILVNTSFNLKGEPIVCTISDAFKTFMDSGIDILVAGPFIIDKRSFLKEAAVIEPVYTEDQAVFQFYKKMPFNTLSSPIDLAAAVAQQNTIAENFPYIGQYFKNSKSGLNILDAGCGTGWFLHSAARYYGVHGIGFDQNPTAIRFAQNSSRFILKSDSNIFLENSFANHQPNQKYDLANCMGVLHHIKEFDSSLKKLCGWVADNGYLHLGLYHRPGRKPFLDHFNTLKSRGLNESELMDEFRKLVQGQFRDEIHFQSWFRDQILHPFESQHSYAEIAELLNENGFKIVLTNLNEFRPNPKIDQILKIEEDFEQKSVQKLKQLKYYPGFMILWAQKVGNP